MTNQESNTIKKSSFFRRLLYLAIFLFVICPIIFLILINIPAVQNFLVEKYTDNLSESTGTEISIDRLDLNVFKGLTSSGVLIKDPNAGDTLLQVDELTVGLKDNLLYLFKDQLSLDDIYLKGLRINSVKEAGKKSSLEQFLDKLSNPDKKQNRTKSSLDFSLKLLKFEDLVFQETDLQKGTVSKIGLESAMIDIQTFDLVNQIIFIRDIELNNPILHRTRNSNQQIFVSETGNENADSTEEKLPFAFKNLGMNVVIGNTKINNGEIKTAQENNQRLVNNEFDPHNFYFDGINVVIENLNLSEEGFKANLKNVAANNLNGYDLKEFSSLIAIDDRKLEFTDLKLKTDNSLVKNNFALKYRSIKDFEDFANKIIIDSKFERTNIAFKELNYYVPVLSKQAFFQQNQKRNLNLKGKFRGKVNNLSGREVEISIDDVIALKGKIDTRDITNPDYTLINVQCDELTSDVYSLKQILPAFNPPENYYKLGDISFSGRFDGFYYDFVAFGDLQTSLGSADLDMRLDVNEGRELASYTGVLNLNQFDLAAWLENDDLGLVSVQSIVKDGKGLTLKNAFADLSAEIKAFTYKGYNYENILMTGQLDKSRFNGDLEIKNKDVDLVFNGNFEFEDNVYNSDFSAQIDKLDLMALNISDKPFSIKGDISSMAAGTGLDDFIGEAEFGNLELLVSDTLYTFDTLYINSSPDGLDNRNANVISESFSLSIDGDFDLGKLPEVVKWQIAKSHPYYASKLKIPAKSLLTRHQDMNFKASITDSKNYLDLLGLKDVHLKDFKVKGAIDTKKEFLSFESKMNKFSRNDAIGYNLHFDLLNKNDKNKIVASIDSISIINRKFDRVYLDVNMDKDISEFSIDTKNLADSLQVFNLRGKVVPEDEGIKISFENDRWEMFSSEWNFSKENYITIKDDFIEVKNLSMTDGYRIIVIDDIQENTGVDVALRNFDFKLIDGLIDYDKISFTGEGDVDFSYFNIFKDPSFDMKLIIPELMLNDISYGEASIDIHDSNESVIASVLIENEIHSIKVFGTYDLEKKAIKASLKANSFQMKFFEDFILTDGISQTGGLANVYVEVTGPMNDIKLNGDAIIHNGSVKIDYLGNLIRYDKQSLKISETYIDLNGFEIIDIEGNVGQFTGGLHHEYITDFVVEVDAKADRFVGLNTTKEDNPLYYGYGVGNMDIEFRGPFSSTDIKVNATTSSGTELSIPVSDYQEGYENSFITFIDSSTHQLSEDGFIAYDPQEFKIEGVDVEMNLDLTPAANVNIIFNEKVNDIIKGRGEGDLRVLLKRTGEFAVFGDYEVFEGEYLFTAWDLIAKPFVVKRGGLIRWTGDPINAELNINASYENLRAPLNVFLSEYLSSATQEIQDLARERTEVDLNLTLTGQLYQPNVSFDLEFPNLTGELRSYASSKVNTLRQNESELNNQVVGLLIFNTFLPTTNNLNSDIYTLDSALSTTFNTVSEFVSTQLSFILSGFLQEALEENGFISGIDFDIGFNNNSLYALDSGTNGNYAPDEIEVNLRNRFFDDRWELNLGGNFVRQDATVGIENNYIIGDFVIAYYLTADKRLKLRGYGKYDIDEVDQQREQKYGFGLSYRKEFGSLVELKKAIKSDTNKMINGTSGQE